MARMLHLLASQNLFARLMDKTAFYNHSIFVPSNIKKSLMRPGSRCCQYNDSTQNETFPVIICISLSILVDYYVDAA